MKQFIIILGFLLIASLSFGAIPMKENIPQPDVIENQIHHQKTKTIFKVLRNSATSKLRRQFIIAGLLIGLLGLVLFFSGEILLSLVPLVVGFSILIGALVA